MSRILSFYNQHKIQHNRLEELQNIVNSFEHLNPIKTTKKLAQVCLNNKQGEMSPSLEPLVGLLMLARESRLSNIISTFDDFKKLFDISSLQINNFLQQSFI
jgi:23S rRNA maturation mini-RNase III